MNITTPSWLYEALASDSPEVVNAAWDQLEAAYGYDQAAAMWRHACNVLDYEAEQAEREGQS